MSTSDDIAAALLALEAWASNFRHAESLQTVISLLATQQALAADAQATVDAAAESVIELTGQHQALVTSIAELEDQLAAQRIAAVEEATQATHELAITLDTHRSSVSEAMLVEKQGYNDDIAALRSDRLELESQISVLDAHLATAQAAYDGLVELVAARA